MVRIGAACRASVMAITLAIATALLSSCTRGEKTDGMDVEAIYDLADSLRAEGSLTEAHLLFRQAMDKFAENGQFDRASNCCYQIFTDYFNQRDMEAMQKMEVQMRNLLEKHPEENSIAYDYYSVLAAMESVQLGKAKDPSDSLRDTMFMNFKKALEFQEKMSVEEQSRRNLQPVWNYYNVAVLYDLMFDPPLSDSTRKYLDKAAEVCATFPHNVVADSIECEVSIRDLRAWLYYYDGKYSRAEAEMDTVCMMIESLKPFYGNKILTEQGEAYSFYIELYTKTGDMEKAMHYQQLLNQNDKDRYNVSKNAAMHEIETRYDVAKKDVRINFLHRRNRILMVSGILLLLALAGAILIVFRREKHHELRRSAEARAAKEAADALHSSILLMMEQMGISNVNPEYAQEIIESAKTPLSNVEQKYLLCFLSGMPTQAIADIFHVEPASVYTVRYRLKKKVKIS